MKKQDYFQGRSEEQLRGSYMGAAFGMIGMLLLLLLSILFNLL